MNIVLATPKYRADCRISFAVGKYRQERANQMKQKTIKDLALELVVEISNECDTIKGKSIFTNQLLRCSSSVGANAAEAKYAQSSADFIHKLELSLKECNETDYWLELLFLLGCFTEEKYKHFSRKNGTIKRMLITSITTAKSKS